MAATEHQLEVLNDAHQSLLRVKCFAGDLCGAPKSAAPVPFFDLDAAMTAAFAELDAALGPGSGTWRPITDSTAPDHGGFNVARQGEDR